MESGGRLLPPALDGCLDPPRGIILGRDCFGVETLPTARFHAWTRSQKKSLKSQGVNAYG
jgi:hypothetical protein